MPTIAEMDAHLAYIKAWHRKCLEDDIIEATEELKTERNRYFREDLEQQIENAKRDLASGKWD